MRYVVLSEVGALVADTDEDGDFIAKARQAAAQEKLNATSAPTVIGKKRGAGTGTACTSMPKFGDQSM